ncbi:reverse transcriptase domain-containing protein [Tanacetum coccineum]
MSHHTLYGVKSLQDNAATFKSTRDDVSDSALRRNICNRNPDVNLLKEDVANVPVWVKLHGVPVMAFSEDGLSAIATKLGTPLMLNSYTSDMCMQSWGRSIYIRAMIKLWADVELKDTIMVAMPKHVGRGFICLLFVMSMSGNLLSMRVASQAPRGVLVGHKVGFKPVKQVYRTISKKKNANTGGNKKKDVKSRKKANSGGTLFWNVGSSSTSAIRIVEKIDKLKKIIINGKPTLVDDEGKPLEKVDYSDDHGSKDEVELVDNEMASFLASKRSIHFVYLPFKEVGCLCNGQRKLVVVGDDGKPLKSCKSMLPSSFNVAFKKVDDTLMRM